MVRRAPVARGASEWAGNTGLLLSLRPVSQHYKRQKVGEADPCPECTGPKELKSDSRIRLVATTPAPCRRHSCFSNVLIRHKFMNRIRRGCLL
jgi:hypothetical protein